MRLEIKANKREIAKTVDFLEKAVFVEIEEQDGDPTDKAGLLYGVAGDEGCIWKISVTSPSREQTLEVSYGVLCLLGKMICKITE
jgi:hypothetical protein